MENLYRLADLLLPRNRIDNQIAELIGRPAGKGNISEYIAARIFDIELHPVANRKGSDGRFSRGELAGRTVNIKYYSENEYKLDLPEDQQDRTPEFADYYLVLTGPPKPPGSSQGRSLPFVIEAVYLFHTPPLLEQLRQREVKIGIATSVGKETYDKAEVYPTPRNPLLCLTEEQRELLKLFSAAAISGADRER